MKRITILIFSIVFSINSIKAQAFVPSESILGRMEEHSFQNGAQKGKFLPGTFLNENWEKGKIKLEGKDALITYDCTYNIPQDLFIFRDHEKIISLKNPKSLEYIDYIGKRFVYYASAKDSGYFEEIVSGKARLLKKHIAIFEKKVDAAPYVDEKPAHYLIKERYFLVLVGQEPVLLAKSRKSVAAQFTDKSTQVLNFIKSEKLKPTDEADMAKIVAYYNSL